MSVRSQIFDTLRADPTLLGLLKAGTDGVINETEFTANSPLPCIVVHYLGPHAQQNLPELENETWEVRAYDRDQAYYNIEKILERVRYVLHRKTLAPDIGGTSSGLEVMYGWKSRARHDVIFRADTESMVFIVPVLHTT